MSLNPELISLRPQRRRRLPWPASTIERDVLHSLWLEAKASGKPITAIVKEAIESHLNGRLDLPQQAA